MNMRLCKSTRSYTLIFNIPHYPITLSHGNHLLSSLIRNRHAFYTIPPAIALSYLYRPLATKIDVYKVLFLITVSIPIFVLSHKDI